MRDKKKCEEHEESLSERSVQPAWRKSSRELSSVFLSHVHGQQPFFFAKPKNTSRSSSPRDTEARSSHPDLHRSTFLPSFRCSCRHISQMAKSRGRNENRLSESSQKHITITNSKELRKRIGLGGNEGIERPI